MAVSAVILSGEALLKIHTQDDLKTLFLTLAEKAQVLLACRVSPKQKADIVNIVKQKYPSIRTLAIGDGANDVNMIT